jgi:CheY-like chemotaxis protein/HPt (histidine-containing phosphotransfer) domain-containing protein
MPPAFSEDDLEDRLRVEFVDDARDRLERMYSALRGVAEGRVKDTDCIASLRMEVHSLKGCGTAFGYPAISLVTMRMEDYLSGLTHLNERQIADALTFLDRTSELVDRNSQPDVAQTNQLIRSLPTRYVFDIKDVEVHNVEIMLVTPSKVVAKKVGTELAACGYRMVTVHDPIESISLAVRMPPDMVIASMVMEGLSGLDLIRGLRAMSVTRKVPMALLTSMDQNNAALKEIPPGVGVIRVGPTFSDELAAVMAKTNLG